MKEKVPLDVIRYVTKAVLMEIKKYEDKCGQRFHHMMRDGFIAAMDEHTKLPVIFAMVHNDSWMRVMVLLDEHNSTAMIDMPFETYNELPRWYKRKPPTIE